MSAVATTFTMPYIPRGMGAFVLPVYPIFCKNRQEQQCRGRMYLSGHLRCVVNNRALSTPLLEVNDERLLRAAPQLQFQYPQYLDGCGGSSGRGSKCMPASV